MRGYSAEDIARVLAPDILDRTELIARNYHLPGLAKWRESNPIGAELDSRSHIVRANHFRINTR